MMFEFGSFVSFCINFSTSFVVPERVTGQTHISKLYQLTLISKSQQYPLGRSIQHLNEEKEGILCSLPESSPDARPLQGRPRLLAI